MATRKAKQIQNADEHALDVVDAPVLQLPTHIQRFIHLYSTGQDTIVKLAQLLDVHPNTIHNWLKRQDVKDILVEMQTATHEVVTHQLKQMSMKAINKLNDLVDSPIDGVAFQAVRDILDRAGHRAKQEIKVDKTVTTIEQKMKELIDSTIVDADFEVMSDD